MYKLLFQLKLKNRNIHKLCSSSRPNFNPLTPRYSPKPLPLTSRFLNINLQVTEIVTVLSPDTSVVCTYPSLFRISLKGTALTPYTSVSSRFPCLKFLAFVEDCARRLIISMFQQMSIRLIFTYVL